MILNDPQNEANLQLFLKTLCNLVCSFELEAHPSQVTEEDASEYLSRMEVDSIDEFLEENYAKYYLADGFLSSEINQNKSPQKVSQNFEKEKQNFPQEEKDELIDINKIDNIVNNFQKKIAIKTFIFKNANPHAQAIFQASGILLRYDQGKDDLEALCENAVFIIYKLNEFEYFIAVNEEGDKHTFTSCKITQETNLVVNKKENCILWLGKDSNVINAYNFIFDDKSHLEELKKLLTKSQYEQTNQINYDELKEEDKQWLENVNNCELDASSSAMDIEMDLETDYMESDTGGNNVASAQAYLHDRTFIVRDDNIISVYKSEDDHTLTVRKYFLNLFKFFFIFL